MPAAAPSTQPRNDRTARDTMWRRFEGDEWAAFDALPASIRHRLHEHAYDPWAVNALMLWRAFRRRHASSDRALVTLRRALDQCEALELAAFSARHQAAYGKPLPHAAARATVQRY